MEGRWAEVSNLFLSALDTKKEKKWFLKISNTKKKRIFEEEKMYIINEDILVF